MFHELYSHAKLTRRITASYTDIIQCGTSPNQIKNTLHYIIAKQVEGKCSIEGFVAPRSITIVSHSCGVLSGPNITYEVVFDCLVCCPPEGCLIHCVAKNITQAGIRAIAPSILTPSPIEVYLSRDFHKKCSFFDSIQERDNLIVKVMGQRFVLNDPHVSIIGIVTSILKPAAQSSSSQVIAPPPSSSSSSSSASSSTSDPITFTIIERSPPASPQNEKIRVRKPKASNRK